MFVSEDTKSKKQRLNQVIADAESSLEETVSASLPASGFLKRLLLWVMPSRFPVAIKLAFSIGILITVGMSLLGAVIIHNQIVQKELQN